MDGNNEEDGFPHYTPQHPLPEEIKKLARDDTVCKYCGVSYLIHNEIKALEDKLAVLEKELATLRGQEQREALLKKENALLKDQRNDLQSSLQTENNLVASLKTELESLMEKQKGSENTAASYKEKYMTTLRQFSALSQVVRQQKQTLHQTREEANKGKDEILGLLQETTQKVTLIAQSAKKDHDELQSQVQCLEMEKMVLSQSNTSLTSNLQVAGQRLAERESELNTQKETVNKLEKYMQDSESLSHSLKVAEKSLQDSQRDLEASQRDLEASQAKCKACERELEQCKAQLKSKTSEVTEMTSKINQLEKNHEVALQKLTLELKAKDGEVLSGLKQQKTLENRIREMERREAEGQHSRDITINEAKDLKDSLQRAKADREALKAERELMIEAHQNRIEELRESFKNKMAEMDNWPQKLQAAVAAEKSKHQAEMKSLEENLKHNFVLELQIEKDKYNELLKKFQSQERDKNNMRQTEHAQLEQKYKQEVEELKRQLSESKVRHLEREEELTGEITSLKKIINDLQDRLARLDSDGSVEMTQLKATLAEVQQELSDAHSSTAGVQVKLKEAQEEAKFLQNIVQKECEERFELTEALSEARRQLLEFKRPPGGYSSNGSKRGSVASLGSAHSTTSSQGGGGGGMAPQSHTPSLPQNIPAATPPSLSKRIEQQASNILLSYSNKSNSNNNGGGNSSSNGGGGVGRDSTGGSKSNEAQLRESRMRIAHMMGRIS